MKKLKLYLMPVLVAVLMLPLVLIFTGCDSTVDADGLKRQLEMANAKLLEAQQEIQDVYEILENLQINVNVECNCNKNEPIPLQQAIIGMWRITNIIGTNSTHSMTAIENSVWVFYSQSNLLMSDIFTLNGNSVLFAHPHQWIVTGSGVFLQLPATSVSLKIWPFRPLPSDAETYNCYLNNITFSPDNNSFISRIQFDGHVNYLVFSRVQ